MAWRWATVLRAFDPRRNLAKLLVPPEGHLRPLDGIRALSILWVVVFHTGWYVGRVIPLPMYVELLTSSWMLPIWRGDFGVDVFFVLSGFLIAGMLVDERADTGRVRLGLFYVRRLMRLWPALGIAVALNVVVIGDHPDKVWANLLYVNNFLPILDAAMGWTWSLSIEEQFYLLCPWLVRALARVGPRGRLTALGGVALALAAVGAWVVVAGSFHASDAEIVINRDFFRWTLGYDHLYVKPWMRAGALLAGVAAAYVYRIPAAMDALSRSGARGALGLAGAIAIAVACVHWPLVEHAPRAVEVAYLALYRTLFGVAVAYVLLLSISRHPVGLALGRVLSARVLYPISQLAYSAYLLNPIVATVVHETFVPFVWVGQASPMALFLPLDAVTTFAAASVVHVFVERPFMELRPRGPGAAGKSAGPEAAPPAPAEALSSGGEAA